MTLVRGAPLTMTSLTMPGLNIEDGSFSSERFAMFPHGKTGCDADS